MASFFSTLRRSLNRLLIALPVLLGLLISAPAQAAQWDAETLTVPADGDGALVTFSEQEIKTGRKVFNVSCGTCHAGWASDHAGALGPDEACDMADLHWMTQTASAGVAPVGPSLPLRYEAPRVL